MAIGGLSLEIKLQRLRMRGGIPPTPTWFHVMELKYRFRPLTKRPTNGSSIPGKSKWVSLSLLQAVLASSWAHPAPYSMGRGSVLEGKAVGSLKLTTHLLLILRQLLHIYSWPTDAQVCGLLVQHSANQTRHFGCCTKRKRTASLLQPTDLQIPVAPHTVFFAPLPLSTMHYISLSSHHSKIPDDLTVCGTEGTQ
jgi:hypothetical protein